MSERFALVDATARVNKLTICPRDKRVRYAGTEKNQFAGFLVAIAFKLKRPVPLFSI